MARTAARCLVVLVLLGLCWLVDVNASMAQPLVSPASTPTLTIAMAKKTLFSFSGKAPTNLGVTAGTLAACPNTPNCVSSRATDTEHQIAPITYESSPAEAMAKLKAVIDSLERTKVVTATDDYLYVEFTSALMGFVDDVEFYFDPSTPGQLQVRSASRLGQSDLGVNRKRIETIRAKFAES